MQTWNIFQVQHKNGDWFSSYDKVPENKQSWVRPSMFPHDNMDEMNIERWFVIQLLLYLVCNLINLYYLRTTYHYAV